MECAQIPIRQVLAESEDQDPHDHMKPTRDEEGDPPGAEGRRASSPDQLVDQGHDQLGRSAAHVAPAGSSAVDKADDLAVEHGAHPVLARDKGGKGEANHEADGDVATSIRDEGHAEDGGGAEHDEEGTAVAGTKEVADGAHG